MIRAFSHVVAPPRLQPLALIVLATLLGAGCASDSAAPGDLSDSPSAATPAGTPVALDSSATVLAAVTYTGIPFGPVALWTMNKLNYGPAPFTASQQYINADTLILQINAARSKGQRLMLAMTGGLSTRYTTNGQFDMAKWKAVQNTYNKAAIKTAVAAAVTDGTVIGNQMIDEPETKRWGTNITKATLDQMAAHVKTIFPTLPVGLNLGPPGYKWRATERFTKVDYVLYQYNHFINGGNIVAWRDAVLAQAKLDGVRPALSLNILNGGKQDRTDGVYDCAGADQGEIGTYFPNCTMTSTQLRNWGKALAPYGCFMMMWEYQPAYMANAANKLAFQEIATLAKSKPKPTCKRP